MDRQPASVHIIRLITKQIEKLGIHDRHDQIKAIIRVAHNDKQGCLSVSQGVQFQLVIGCKFPQLCNVKRS